MTAKEKAKELIEEYTELLGSELPALHHLELIKGAAIIGVKEIANIMKTLVDEYSNDFIPPLKFWNEVLEELNKA